MQTAPTTLESALGLSPHRKAIALMNEGLHILIVERDAGEYYNYIVINPQTTTDSQTGEQVTRFQTTTMAGLNIEKVYYILAEEERLQLNSEVWHILTDGRAETLASLLGRAPELVRI